MSAQSTADNSTVSSKPMSPSTSSGPKPLHLPLASVVGSSNSPSTPDFSSLAADADPSASVHGSRAQSEKSITLNSPTGSSPLSPSISGLRKQSSNPHSRRQSSISYISSPPSYSPSTPQFAFNSKRQSVDAAASAALVRSPLSSVHPSFAFVDTLDLSREGSGGGAGLGRSNSLGGRAGRGASSRSPRSPNVGERSSTGSIASSQHARHLKERPPATLAEKHAELLHFIAQKESKCLELRSQLAMHETELLQLKRKWERIVNRGFAKALSPNSSNTNTSSVHPSDPYASTSTSSSLPLSASPTLPSSLASPFSPNSSTSTSTSSTSPPSSSYFPTLSLNAPHSASSAAQGVAHGAVVLEGIKESVQGMSRFIAAGLESIVHVGPPTPAVVSEAESGHYLTAPLPLMLGSGVGVNVGSIPGSGSGSITTTTMMTATTTTTPSFTAANIKNIKKSKRQSYLGHEQKESQSSSSTSTSTSTSTFTSTSTSTSVTSAASVTSSLRSGLSTLSSGSGSGTSTTKDGGGESTAPDAHVDEEDDAEDDFGDFETGQAPPQAALAFHSRSSSSPSLEDEQEQVLMVRDTGATPTMSPNPAFEKRMRREGRKEKERVKVERLVLSPGFAVNDKDRERQQQQRGDGDEFGWDDDAWGDSLSSSVSSTGTSRSQSRPQPQRNQQNQQHQQQQHRTQDPSKSSNANSNSSTRPKSPLAPMSSMPGLSMGMNMNMNTPTAQQVSSWVGSMGTSVGKKWGEIAKGGSTFVKNQKRASLLLSDMQQSIVSALGSPAAISNSNSNPNSATKASSPLQTPYTPAFSSNASQRAATTPTSASTSTSLLDDSDDESYGESSRGAIVPVMVPDSLTGPSGLKLQASAAPLAAALKTPQVVVKQTTVRTGTKEDEDEDEWNW